MRELPDADDGAQDEQAVDDGLKETAFFFFRPDEHCVSRFSSLIEGLVCFHKVAFLNAMAVPRAITNSQTTQVQTFTVNSQFREARNLFRPRDQAVPILGRRRIDEPGDGKAVIPRLAKHAEGLLKRAIATAYHSVRSARDALTFAEVASTTARSLGVLRQLRDDRVFTRLGLTLR
jgi:hypothetical protein